jgi:hypothetical protein
MGIGIRQVYSLLGKWVVEPRYRVIVPPSLVVPGFITHWVGTPFRNYNQTFIITFSP